MAPGADVHHPQKDPKLDGNNPTYLYGYGGFSVSRRGSSDGVWCGWKWGIYATDLRGGEYGELA
jgi:prolyl oligopeptidase